MRRPLFTLLCLAPWLVTACGTVEEEACTGVAEDRGITPVTEVDTGGGAGGWAPGWLATLGEDVFGTRVGADSKGNVVWGARAHGRYNRCGPDVPPGVVVAKLRPDASPLWTTTVVGDGFLEALSVAPNDDIVIGGYFSGTLEYGGGALTSAGGEDAFVAKLDPDGSVVWARGAGDAAIQQRVFDVAVAADGDIAITGEFVGTLDWGTGPLVGSGDVSLFVAKLDANGDARWAARHGGDKVARGSSVILDAQGDVVVAGAASGVLDLGGTTLVDPGGLLVKLDRLTGAPVWSHALGDRYGALALGPDNRYFFAGKSSEVPFLSKYDAGGALLFDQVFSAGPTIGGYFAPPAVDDSFVVLGFSQDGGIDLGAGEIGGEGARDLVIGAFDLDGANLWSVSYPSSDAATGALEIALTPGHDVFVSGLFEGTLDLGFTKLDVDGVEDQDPFLLFLGHR